jgi:hypothetical protein
MTSNKDLIESAAGAFSGPSRSAFGDSTPEAFGRPGLRRRARDPAALWVQITLSIVVAALLLSVIAVPRPRPRTGSGSVPQKPHSTSPVH